MTLFISAGHGWKAEIYDPGAMNDCLGDQKSECNEHELCSDIVEMVEYLLSTTSIRVIRVPGAGITQKAKTVNEWGDANDFFAEFHLNASSDPTIHGTMTLYHPNSEKGRTFGRFVHDWVVKGLGTDNLGLRKGYFQLNRKKPVLGILRKTIMPALVLEPEFLSNDEAAFALASGYFKQKIACTYAEALYEWVRG